MNNNNHLDEKGFVFIGDDYRPYWCRMDGDTPWFYSWHPDKKWISLKQVSQMEVWIANTNRLTEEQANMYHQFAAPWILTKNDS